MGKFFTLFIIFVLSAKLSVAQQNIIEHSIQKGETIYSISKKYGVSMNAIFKLNAGSKDIIYAGDTLRIPDSNSSNTSPDSTAVITDTGITNYTVKRGDTKFGLSKRFGVSIAMLEQQNPHIRSMLQAGHVINLDKTIAKKESEAKKGEHIVVKGETLWGISQRYGIPLAQLTAANSGRLSEFLQIGQVLTISDKNLEFPDEDTYLVKRGDTKFSLAKRFNMTIAELEERNPHIVDMLMAGHKLNLKQTKLASSEEIKSNTEKEEGEEDTIAEAGSPESDATTETEEKENTTEEETPIEGTVTQIDSIPTDSDTLKNVYKDYVILPKETLYSLAQKAGMTIVAFTELNPKLLTSVNTGDIIKMPVNAPTTPEDRSLTESDNTVSLEHKNDSLYANLETLDTKGLYFYTPFSDKELSSPDLREKLLTSNANYRKYLDFFQGSQIAIDSALALNLNFDIRLIKEGDVQSTLEIESAYKKNAILVPFLENGTDYPKMESNESISVIDIESNINPIENSIVYNSIPSENFQKTQTLNYLAKKDAQVIVVSDTEEARNKDLILNIIPSAKFLTVDKAGFFKGNTLDKALDKNKLNYVILDSEKTIVFLNSTTALMSKLSNYNIQLVIINASLIPEKSEVSDMRYRVLKLIFPAVLDRKNTKFTIAFEKNYENLFNQKPSKHAILGFDITLDILLRLSQNSSFEDTIKSIPSEHSHIKFDYQKVNNSNYSNTRIYLMQYDANEGLIELNN